MAQPLPYERDYDFTSYQTRHTSTPLPAFKLDAEFDAVAGVIDQVLLRIKDLQRDDLELANRLVGYDQLKDELRNGFTTPTVWSAGKRYALSASVYVGRRVYAALSAHTSAADFNTDLVGRKWHLLADFTAVTQVDQSAIDAAAAAAQSAEDAAKAALGIGAALASAQAAASASAEFASDSSGHADAASGFADAAAQSVVDAAAVLASAVRKENNLSDVPNKEAAKKNLLVNEPFATTAAAEAYTPDTAPDFLRTAFLDAAQIDGSGSDYKHAGTVDPVIPGQIEITAGGVTHFYTRSNKVLRPQQHGCKTGGDQAVNRAALSEMFALANRTGNEIDMGSANDVYDIDDQINVVWTKKPVIRGSGATIKLNRPLASPTVYGLYFRTDNLGLDLEGFHVDGGWRTPNPLWIDNTATDYVKANVHDARLVGVGGTRGYRKTIDDYGGAGLSLRGWFRSLHAEDCFARDMLMAVGAGSPGNAGIIGIQFGRTSAGAHPIYKEIINPQISGVTSEDVNNLVDMDGLLVFDALPPSGFVRPAGTTSIRGGMIQDCWGRGIKLQASNVDIVGTHGELSTAPTGGQTICFIDFQFGGGRFSGGSLRCSGKSPKNVIVAQSHPLTAGQTVVEGLQYFASAGTPEPDSLAWRYPENSARVDGGLVVENCHTRVGTVKNIARFSSRAAAVTERVSVKDNMVGVTSAGVAFEFFGSEPLAATIKDNFNLTTASKPLYTRKNFSGTPVTNTVDVKGVASDNWYFTAGT